MRVAVLQGQGFVLAGLDVPERLEFLDQVGVLGTEVVAFRSVGIGVVQSPSVQMESARIRRCGGVQCVGLPAVAPQRSGAEKTVELDGLVGLRPGIVEAVHEAGAFQGPLGVSLDLVRRLDMEALVDRRNQIGAVVVLVSDLAPGFNAIGPVHNQRIAHTPFPGPRLEQLEGGVERRGPAVGVVIERGGRTQLVEQSHILVRIVGYAVEELVLVDRSGGPALRGGTVIGDDEDEGVVEFADPLEVVDQPADVMIGVADEPGEHLCHPDVEALLIIGERIPRADHTVGVRLGHCLAVEVGQLR